VTLRRIKELLLVKDLKEFEEKYGSNRAPKTPEKPSGPSSAPENGKSGSGEPSGAPERQIVPNSGENGPEGPFDIRFEGY